MRTGKSLGYALILALLMTAALVAIPAQAQAEEPGFCEVNKEPCPAESIVPEFLSQLIAPGMSFGKFIGGGSVTCSEATFHVLEEVELPLWRYKPAGFVFGGCTSATYTNCGVTWLGQYSAELLPGGGGDGGIRVFESQPFKEGVPALEVSCTYLKTAFSCVYATTEFLLGFSGGTSATIQQSVSLKRASGSPLTCPEAASMKASYETEELPWDEPFPALYMTEN